MVLLAALVVLGVAGSLLAASFFAERERWSTRLVAGRADQLHGIAEQQRVALRAGWDTAARFAQLPESTVALSPVAVAGTAVVDRWISRLSAWTYRGVVSARDVRDSSLDAVMAATLLVDAPRFAALGALVARGDVRVDGGLTTAAPDSAAAVACDAGPVSVPGVVMAPGAIGPDGAVEVAAAGDDSTYHLFGGVTVDTLAARAGIRLPGGAVVSAIRAGVAYAEGDLELSGGDGAGLLLVKGALTVSGSVTFRGVIVAGGGVVVSGGRFAMSGLLLAEGGAAAVAVNSLAELHLAYDPCAVEDAEWHAGRVIFASVPTEPVAP
ncbi:MAG: hypothetical protein KGL93_05555 [Gemmatimonadota bacterium]|nr:hypothetical protein [Gemmatimonadota bacterium]